MKKTISLFTVTLLLITFFISCKNDNEGYREYYNSMGNNPVQVIPWLIDTRKSLDKKEAKISWYQLNKQDFYVVQAFVQGPSSIESPFTIYESDEERRIIYFHSDNILDLEKDLTYDYFIENAVLVELLWSNEKRYSTID